MRLDSNAKPRVIYGSVQGMAPTDLELAPLAAICREMAAVTRPRLLLQKSRRRLPRRNSASVSRDTIRRVSPVILCLVLV